MISIIQAIKHTDYKIIENLADTIWREHYIPIIGKPQ